MQVAEKRIFQVVKSFREVPEQVCRQEEQQVCHQVSELHRVGAILSRCQREVARRANRGGLILSPEGNPSPPAPNIIWSKLSYIKEKARIIFTQAVKQTTFQCVINVCDMPTE